MACPEVRQKGSLCLSCAEIDEKTPFWNAEANECQSCRDACGSEKSHWNPDTGACEAECPLGQPSGEDADCSRCSEVSPQSPKWDETANECVACPAGLSWRKKLWLARPQCVQACPDAMPYEL